MEGFSKLQELGAKSITAATHIPLMHVEQILNRDFEHFTKPQLLGFFSILEREYKIDLSDLKQEYLFTKAENEIKVNDSFDIAEQGSKLLENPKALLHNKKFIYGSGAIIVIALLITILNSIDFSSSETQKVEINNSAIDKAKQNLNIKTPHPSNVEEMMENNDVESAEFGQDEANVTEKKASDTVAKSEPSIPLYFRIIPKSRLWLGLINADTHKRRVETISKPLELDAEKTWLVVTGYGHLDLDCGDETLKFREDKKLLFLYENGICQVIDKEEFKARNRGKLW